MSVVQSRREARTVLARFMDGERFYLGHPIEGLLGEVAEFLGEPVATLQMARQAVVPSEPSQSIYAIHIPMGGQSRRFRR